MAGKEAELNRKIKILREEIEKKEKEIEKLKKENRFLLKVSLRQSGQNQKLYEQLREKLDLK